MKTSTTPGTAALTAALTTALLFSFSTPSAARAQSPNQTVDPAFFQELHYRSIGPSRGGRVTTVAGHPSEPHTFYMGTVGGGVWRTTDAGQSWVNLTDGQITTSSAMGAVQVAPSDPNVIYAGTGSDGIRSNVILGRGIYRSTDHGSTWTLLGLEKTGQIGSVEVDPNDPDLVYVAALGSPFGRNPERGVYRSRDGGASWRRVLFTSDSVGAVDLELAPDDPMVIYAAMWRGERKPWTIISGMPAAGGEDGIWKSTDGGDTWMRMENGLPTGLIGKIDLAVTPADPDRVYALVEAPDPDEGLYRSDDRGRTWRLVSNQSGLMNRPFYYTNVDADPKDADVVYVNNEDFYKSLDGGKTFQQRSTPHGDNHDMWINPDHPEIFIQSNDGGANVTLNGGRTWSTQNNQPTAELYQVDVDDRFPYRVYAGQQDASTIAVPSLPPAEPDPSGPTSWWKDVGGCETGPAVPKPGDPDIVYSNCKGRFGRFSFVTGQEQQYYVGAVDMYGANPSDLPYRFQRTVPIEVSPNDPNVVYNGSQYVHRSTDGGIHWERISPDLTAHRPERQVTSGTPITRDITGEEHYSTLYVIEESPNDPEVIWAGANDGPVHVTRNGGESWQDVTPPGMPPEGRINAIEISPHQPGRVYVAGYRWLLNDFKPYLYETTDYGQSWRLLTPGDNGIPADDPVTVVREDPKRDGLLYAGTEFGMYVSFDDGAHWQPFQLDLPLTWVSDIEPYRGDLVVSTMGRGFWIMDDVTPLEQVDEARMADGVHLYDPRPAYRMRYRTGGFRGRSPDDPEYPAPGALLDYYVPESAAGSRLTLAIQDELGNVIRRFEGGGVLKASPGMHRFLWDMRYPGPRSDGRRRSGGRGDEGPLVVPGTYRVGLAVDGRPAETRDLEVLIDPRVEADGVTVANLTEQRDLSLRVRDALSEARQDRQEIQELKDQLSKSGRQDRASGQVLAGLSELERRLVPDPKISSYPPRLLLDQLEYLYGMLDDADQKPGQDAHQRYRELRSRVDDVTSELGQLKGRVAELASAGS